MRLQPPWSLNLEQTILRGYTANPQLLALQAAREALLRQADRRAAELLPSLRLVAAAGYGDSLKGGNPRPSASFNLSLLRSAWGVVR